MEWRDQGIILGVRRYGEYDVIVEALTEHHGRHNGLVKGGVSRRHRGTLQPGNEVDLVWRGRLESHLGTYAIEPKRMRSAVLLGTPDRLAALSAAAALALLVLPEREALRPVYLGFQALLDALEADDDVWGAVLVRWELGVLEELGFGLDLSRCAGTGTTENLVYVSPRSGRAVSAGAGAPYQDKLLPLPAFLTGRDDRSCAPGDVLDGLELTGYFLARHVLALQNKGLPPARLRLAGILTTQTQK